MIDDLDVIGVLSPAIRDSIRVQPEPSLADERQRLEMFESTGLESAHCRRFIAIDNAKRDSKIAVINSEREVIRLYLNGITLNYFPKEIFQLKKLRFLSLHGIRNLPEIPKEISLLDSLESILLSDLPDLREFPKEIIDLPNLRFLLAEDLLALRKPPKEIVYRGLDAVKNYYRSLDETASTSFLYEAKMVVVGRGFSGKTTLVRKLTVPNYQIESDIRSTEGIDIKYWDIPIPLEKSDSFRFNIWDFGGQEKYDATHQFFITERTLYLFVTEARQESNYLDFDYWLNIVQMLGNDSPIIVVQNKIDQRQKQLPSQKYRADFPNIIEFVDVSSIEGYENTLEELTKQIKRGIHLLPQVGAKLPLEWVDIRTRLKALDVDYISYDEYVKICKRHGLSQKKSRLSKSVLSRSGCNCSLP